MIQIESLYKKFKRQQVLNDITVSFNRGQVISLIGPNGSGKTTLIKSILGMVKPDSGKIKIDGVPIHGSPMYREKIGYMPQIGRYPDNMKVGQLFSMMRNIRSISESLLDEELILKFDLAAIFNKPLRTLSGGTRQKVSASLAFYFNPDILVLDEPTAGLDPLSSEVLKEKILAEKTKNKLILVTSHILSDLDEMTTHIMYLQDGKQVFFKDLATLQEESGEMRLGKAIARIMKGEKFDNSWVDRMFEVNKEKQI